MTPKMSSKEFVSRLPLLIKIHVNADVVNWDRIELRGLTIPPASIKSAVRPSRAAIMIPCKNSTKSAATPMSANKIPQPPQKAS